MIITLTKENFDTEIKTGTVVVKFGVKSGCRPCDEFKPHYDLASEAENGIKYCEYIRDSIPQKEGDLDEIEKKYKINSFPTVVMFENGEDKGTVKRYKFYSNRELQGFILDEQKKLFSQQCFVEDLLEEQRARTQPQLPIPVPVAPEPDFLPPVPGAPHEEPCTSCD